MSEKTININGDIFVYQEEKITYDNVRPISEDEGKALLEKTKQLFSMKNLDFYLAFGTLLGAVRDKTIISGDEDVDVFIVDESLLISILPFLSENGMKLFRKVDGKIYSFWNANHCYIDVYILRPIHWSIWSLYCLYLSNNVTPKKYFKEYEEIEFLGNKYKCPRNPENLLEFWYGKNWKTPIRGHHFIYEVKSAYYWRKIKKEVKKKIKRYIGWIIGKYWQKGEES